MSEVLTTLVVKFVGKDSSKTNLTKESDEKLNVESDGSDKTTFYATDPYYFLLKIEGPGRIKSVDVSFGGVFYLGDVTRSRTDTLDFKSIGVDDDNPTLSYEPVGPRTSEFWVGNVGSGLALDSATKTAHISGGPLPCKVIVDYPAKFYSYKLEPAPNMVFPPGDDTSFDILIMAVVEV